ncbi:OB-fold domain-containing protein [Actinoallomurus purpureus]|uniref:OB-fold domain-containing protein n=1 Tax=Actinoallomurus purpureus TaxID=478114 RepID=UPI0025AF3831|nr:OB-fold domain-containing protein [Actinoallomurus purpureus]
MHDQLMALAGELTAAGERPAGACPDPVNAAMIRNWTQALGDRGTRWAETAPPAMIQVWSMPGLNPDKPGSIADRALTLLNDEGFTGVVATNCEQTYDRYLRHGEHLRSTMRFGGATGPKRTGLGEGYFVTWYQTWYSGDERVAEMMFRVLKFRPRRRSSGSHAAKGYPLRPAVGPDTRFFWDGVRDGELRIQRCAECGRLRHPPGPMCPACQATKRDHVTASGRGTLHSYVVHHHPPVPGLDPPFVVALVELDEGVRMVGNLLGCPPEQVRIGMPVEVSFQEMDDELTLPQWRPAGSPTPSPAGTETGAGARSERGPGAETAGSEPGPEVETAGSEAETEVETALHPEAAEGLPELRVELTPTFVIATALATRDFTPVHHDTALARAQGSKDIFLNILTTMGLVQRYVLEHLPDVALEGISVRLGVPAYAGDTLTLTGRVVDDRAVEVRGAVSLGDHAVATVRLKEQP